MKIAHTLREANSSAIVMAKLGAAQQDPIKSWSNPPLEVSACLLVPIARVNLHSILE